MNNKDNKDYYLPISSYDDYLQNLKYYMEYGIITYYSNFKKQDDFGNEALFRYVYENKLKDNQEQIEKISKKKFATVLKNIRKIVKMDNNLVVASNSPNGIVYTINYSTEPHGYYVTIHHEILKYLLDTSNEDALKLYVFMCYRCKKGETKITLKEMANAIGLSPNSKDNLQKITNITMSFDDNLIKKRYVYETVYDEDTNKFKTKKFCYYTIMTYEQFKDRNDKQKSN